jgi:hypothetical protein
MFGRFDFSHLDILGIGVGEIDRALINDCWRFAETRRKNVARLGRPSSAFMKEVCVEFAQIHSLTGVETVGRRKFFFADRYQAADVPVSTSFIDQVDSLLPPQPWPVGTHLEVAEKLDVAPNMVVSAIRHLIDNERRHEQFDGELFDRDGNTITRKGP